MLLSPLNQFNNAYNPLSANAVGYTPTGKDAIANPNAQGIRTDDVNKKKITEDPSEECQTCKNRKYQDGSNEMVSFKSPKHVSPEASATAVRAHEQEHVSNAFQKAGQNNGKVLSASVTIKTAICPECGRSYVSGGTTQTQIKYYNEENPYQQGLKTAESAKYSGMHTDIKV